MTDDLPDTVPCIDCGAEVLLSEDAKERWTQMNGIAERSRKAPLRACEVARCKPCYQLHQRQREEITRKEVIRMTQASRSDGKGVLE